ncbi:MAG TPA: 2-C-methyl-D-erythritol 4-phosphate cytidylyltransferase [Dehalococcoidia bacterium]|jgi:2-C-methyl-D-erythritol 4-phosphate cytidylyltransferase|nr:2-C-methyl-D-erythritol 4-phosphate cytidylyltransferase [Dehalococcoidia bacterium]
MTTTVGAVIVAAGSGIRMAGADKLFTEIAGRPLLAHAIAPFQDCAALERIVLVLAAPTLERGREIVKQFAFSKVAAVCPGGPRRQDSVRLGLEALGQCDYVAIHDGARPLVTPALIERGLKAARESGAAIPAVPLVDTVKEAGPDGTILRTVDRSRLWAVQTPQVFRNDLILRAHRELTANVTDDAAMVEALGERVRLFQGSRKNFKVTAPEDLDLVTALLGRDSRPSVEGGSTIYHITTRAEWERSKSSGSYSGDALASAGFIHCSAAHQVLAVANSAFRGRRDLVLLCISPDKLVSEIRWEQADQGEAFPHIYGPLNIDAVTEALNLEPDESGTFMLPAELSPTSGSRNL